MPCLNKVQIIGHLGQDPTTRYMPNGDAVCNFSVATTETWKDKQSGEKKEATEWHRFTAYRKLGEICGQYLKKGSCVYLEGKLQTRKWTDKDGVERYTTEIIADSMQMLGSGPNAKNGGDDDYGAPQQSQRQPSGREQPSSRNSAAFDGEIPF